MLATDTFVYRKCLGSNSSIIVRLDSFDAEGTSCQLTSIRPADKKTYLAYFRCTGAGLEWSEDDEIKILKSSWTLRFNISNVKRVSGPIYYCLQAHC
jgi:hypothetical protein